MSSEPHRILTLPRKRHGAGLAVVIKGGAVLEALQWWVVDEADLLAGRGAERPGAHAEAIVAVGLDEEGLEAVLQAQAGGVGVEVVGQAVPDHEECEEEVHVAGRTVSCVEREMNMTAKYLSTLE